MNKPNNDTNFLMELESSGKQKVMNKKICNSKGSNAKYTLFTSQTLNGEEALTWHYILYVYIHLFLLGFLLKMQYLQALTNYSNTFTKC